MKLVFVCVGSPSIKGDSIGPRVGSFLKKRGYIVYGTKKEPITAVNVKRYEDILSRFHDKDLIIGIDAAFGKKEDIGQIKITNSGIRPGGAYCRENKKIGDIGVLAIVADREKERIKSLYTVEEMLLQNLYKKLLVLCEYIFLKYSKIIIKRNEKSSINATY